MKAQFPKKRIYCFWWFEEGYSLSQTQVEYLAKLFGKDRRWDSLKVVSLGLSLFLFALTACCLGINCQLLFPCHSYMLMPCSQPQYSWAHPLCCKPQIKLSDSLFLKLLWSCLFGFCCHIKIKVTTTCIKYDSFIQHLSWTWLF